MTKSKGIYRPRRPMPSTPVAVRGMRWSHYADGPLDTPCLLWDGLKERQGYGMIKVAGRHRKIHRAVWIEQYGIPSAETPYVLHACDTPACWQWDGPPEWYTVNGVARPRHGHLFLGTAADNAADMTAKGRHPEQRVTACPRGHLYSGDNLLVRRGSRECRQCHNAQSARTRAQRTRPTPMNPVE